MLSAFGCGRADERYLLPDGYTGWVEIDYEVSTAPTFPRENGFRLVEVPDTGRVETVESPNYGEMFIREYYYVGAASKRTPAPTTGGGFSQMGGNTGPRSYVLIGHDADYGRYLALYGHVTVDAPSPHVGRLPPRNDMGS